MICRIARSPTGRFALCESVCKLHMKSILVGTETALRADPRIDSKHAPLQPFFTLGA
jgi:hypothetical protein